MFAGYAAGAGIALAAGPQLVRSPDPIHTRYFVVLLSFAGVAFAPAGLVLYAQYPDWSLMYLADPAHLPAFLMLPLLALAYVAMPVAGFVATHFFLRTRNTWGLRTTLGVPAFLALLVVMLGRLRLLTVTYYEMYHHDGSGVPLFLSPLIWALAIIVPFVTGAFVFTVLHVRRHIESIASPVDVGPEPPAQHAS